MDSQDGFVRGSVESRGPVEGLTFFGGLCSCCVRFILVFDVDKPLFAPSPASSLGHRASDYVPSYST
jgi:hypothetical protein